jgi:hypothetical protein
MARQQYNTNPWEKKFEVFQDFSGGLNTVTSQDNLKDNELSDATNFNIAERGSLEPRHGLVQHIHSKTAKGQGYFRFYHTGTAYREIEAIGGVFFVDGVAKPVTGLPDGFQADLPIEGVQFKDKMYFATGSRLVQYDGTEFSVVEPYKPQPLEALYIGLNGLADDPNNFMTDGTSAFPRIDGVTFDTRYGIVNGPINMHAFVSKPPSMVLEYKFERRYTTDPNGFWFISADWSEDKDHLLTVPYEGDLEFKVTIRDQADPTYEIEEYDEEKEEMVTNTYDKVVGEYYVPKYKIKPTADPEDVEPDTSLIHQCRHILLHWNRLIMYGESMNPDMIYVSHLNKPDYFPIPNTLRFENPRNEKLNVLVPFRGMLTAFTDTSIQALHGTSPYDFRRTTLNTGIGCIAPYTARVMKNYITFLSLEGVHILKTIGYTEDKANVEKIDYMVENEIPLDKEASAWFHNGEYHIFFPNYLKRMRYHFELQTWMKDRSPSLDFHRVIDFDGTLYGQKRNDGKLLKFDPAVFTDEGVPYLNTFETKYFSFNQPYHDKKLKEFQILASPVDDNTTVDIEVFADENSSIDPGEAQITLNVVEGLDYERNILSVNGRCLKTKVKISNQQGKNYKIIGFAYVFKLKKP